MQQTPSHTTRKTVGIFILAAIFLSILASLGLPSILEFKDTDQEQVSLNLPEKDMKESYENPDPENEALEEIDFYQEHLLAAVMLQRNGSSRLFSFLTAHLSTRDSDIQLPPPEFIAA